MGDADGGTESNEPQELDRDLDPGAYIGQQPELASERLPDGPRPGDQRVAAHDAAPGVPGEPDASVLDGDLEALGEPRPGG